ncbi:MAG: TetR/AcrR family transcriptional regulator [Herpetosiphonaceae bacterium]|nr:TetR/AcrR family transcriptional regulator [Herpetosiphonaceae bacterium]
MARGISDTHILDAALDVIAQHGYTGATTRQIAAAAGINEVTLFRRFRNKQTLLKAVVEQEAASFVAAGIEYTGDLEADLSRVVHFYHTVVAERGRVIAMLITEIPRQPELLEIMQTPLAIMATIGAMLERYQQEGRLVQEPPMHAFFALVGPVFLEHTIESVQPNIVNRSFDSVAYIRHYLHGRRMS